MLTILILLIFLAGTTLMTVGILCARDGDEDEDGFHFRTPPGQVSAIEDEPGPDAKNVLAVDSLDSKTPADTDNQP
jgi:hypothetical protein